MSTTALLELAGIDLTDERGVYVPRAGFTWRRAAPGARTVTQTLPLIARGTDADWMWNACRDIEARLQAALEARRDDDMLATVPLLLRFGTASDYLIADVVGGMLHDQQIATNVTKDAEPYMRLTLTLECLPYLRGPSYRWPHTIARILTSSDDDPTEITTDRAHGLTTGDVVLIEGHAGSTPDLNGMHEVTVTGDDTFTIAEDVSVAGTGGYVRPAVIVHADDDAEVLVEAVPGDVPALTRWEITDVSDSGAVNRIILGRYSRRLQPLGGLVDLICDAEPGDDSSTEADADAIGGSVERVNSYGIDAEIIGNGSQSLANDAIWKSVASLARPTRDTNLTARVLARVRDSSNYLTPPTGLRVWAVEGTGIRQTAAASETTGGTSISVAWPEETLPGSTLVMYVSSGNTTHTPDDGSWSEAATAQTGSSPRTSIFVMPAADARSGMETVTLGGTVTFRVLVIEEWRGIKAAFFNDPVDETLTNASGSNGTSLALGTTGALSQPEQIVLGMFSAGTTSTLTFSDAGYTTTARGATAATGWKRVRSTSAQSLDVTSSASTTLSGVLVTLEASVEAVEPMATPKTLSVCVAAYKNGLEFSAVSNAVSTVIGAGYFLRAQWTPGRGTPAWFRVFYDDGSGWRAESTATGSDTTLAIGNPVNPPAASLPTTPVLDLAQVRARATLASGAGDPIQTEQVNVRVGNGEFEWLDLGMVKLPPVRSLESESPPEWLLSIDNRYILGTLSSLETFDVDAIALMPAYEDYVEAEIPGLAEDTPRTWVIDTNRDGAVSGYLLDGSGNEVGALRFATGGGHMLAPGDNVVPVLLAIEEGVAGDPADTAVRVGAVITPRYTAPGAGSGG